MIWPSSSVPLAARCTGAFTGHPGEVRVVNYGGGRQGVYLEVNGDTTVDSIIEVYADHGLTAEDFVL